MIFSPAKELVAAPKRLGEDWFFSMGTFLMHFCYFSFVLFGGNENLLIFADGIMMSSEMVYLKLLRLEYFILL